MLRVAEHWSGTDTGLQRRANEDSLLVRSPLFVVADGMGGARAGEVASRVAVDTFSAGLDDGTDPQHGLARRVREANARINELSHRRSEHAGMGTTITAVYVGEQEVSIAHVGDSRAYCLREGELLRLTDDHSLVDELIKQGRLTPEEAEEHPQRSVITRALGPEASVEVDVRSFRARPGDLYLICSDGLTTMVGEDELQTLLDAHARLRDAGEALIAAANAAGGKDNITVVLLRLEEVGAGTGADGAVDQDGHATAVALTPPGPTGVDSGSAGPPAAHTPGAAPATTGTAPATSAPSAAGDMPDSAPTDAAPDPGAARDPGGAAHSRAGTSAVTPRSPRRPPPATPDSRSGQVRRAARRARAPLILLVVLAAVAAGGYLALQSVFFVGTNQRGLVTVFRGIPYELPAGIRLYSSDYVSGVSAATLPPPRRQALLDHSWRSESDAADLVRQLELGQLSGR
jgi:PPM family protein phosphatase